MRYCPVNPRGCNRGCRGFQCRQREEERNRIFSVLLLCLFLSACGGGGDATATSGPDAACVPASGAHLSVDLKTRGGTNAHALCP